MNGPNNIQFGTNPFPLEFEYNNYRGERATRRVHPSFFWWKTSEYHPGGPLLVLAGFCQDRQAWRDFDTRDIHSMREITDG